MGNCYSRPRHQNYKESELEPQLELQLKLQLEQQYKRQPKPQLKPQLERKPEPQLEQQLERQLEPQLQPKHELHHEHQLESHPEPQLEQQSETQSGSQPDYIQRINDFLLSLYENQLKFKRPDDEVECITSAVKILVEKIMTAFGNEFPKLEISRQYLVGSMAEGTSIMEPDEFDFLVVLKHFSDQSEICIDKADGGGYKVYENETDVSSLLTGKYSKKTSNTTRLEPINLSTKLSQVASLLFRSVNVVAKYGTLSIQSTSVCHHGPAYVIKLLWQPSYKSSKPLDILVDIALCIEKQGLDQVKDSFEVALPAHYEALIRDDKYMLIPVFMKFACTFTTTEVKIVQSLSAHHKICYMILKYCLNDIILKADPNQENKSPFSSYINKTFILRHAAKCKIVTTQNTSMRNSLYTCLVDILQDLQCNTHEHKIDGIFGKFSGLFSAFPKNEIRSHIENIIKILVQIGKQGCTPLNNLDFRVTCHRECIHSAVQERDKILAKDKIECHLSRNCKIHITPINICPDDMPIDGEVYHYINDNDCCDKRYVEIAHYSGVIVAPEEAYLRSNYPSSE